VTPEQLKALLAYIDARIFEVVCGGTAQSNEHRRVRFEALARAFGIDPEELK
jgi:hypothetical protein